MGKKHFHFIYNNSYLQDDHIANVLHPFFKYEGKVLRQNGLKFFFKNIFFYSSVSSFYITKYESTYLKKQNRRRK